MIFINLKTHVSKDELLSFVSDNKKVNSNVRFDDRRGTPFMHVKEKDSNLSIKCEMLGGPTKDNGFFVGAFFKGRIKEKNGETKLKGIILTAPIYHLIWFTLLCVMIWQCIQYVAISVLPILFVAFEIMMFSKEFKKQGYIKRYLLRAVARLEKTVESDTRRSGD